MERSQKAWQTLANSGFPTTRNEEWKYTSVRSIVAGDGQTVTPFASCPIAARSVLPADTIARIESLPATAVVVFVDGVYSREYSREPRHSTGVDVFDLQNALLKCPDEVVQCLKAVDNGLDQLPKPLAHIGLEAKAFQNLAASMLYSGAFIRTKPKQLVDDPIYILHVSSSAAVGERLIASPHIIVNAAPQSSLTIIEESVCLAAKDKAANADKSQGLFLPVTAICVGASAQMTHINLANESRNVTRIGASYALLGQNAQFHSTVFTCGGSISRSDFTVMIDGSGAEATLNGLYTAAKNQHIDHHTAIDHRVPNATSNQLYKGILSDGSRAVFNGKVFVRRHAQQTAAYQSNKNLLLGRDAEIDTKPQLEIDADDVKCSHGATVARLTDEEVFYLQSRGIDKNQAEDMLCHAFADDLLDRIPNAYARQRAASMLEDFFGRARAEKSSL